MRGPYVAPEGEHSTEATSRIVENATIGIVLGALLLMGGLLVPLEIQTTWVQIVSGVVAAFGVLLAIVAAWRGITRLVQ